MPVSAEYLLHQKEIHGFYVASFARIFLLCALGFVVYLSSIQQIIIYEICASITLVVLISLVMIYRVHKTRNVKVAGVVGVIFDVLILAILPALWYFLLQEKPVPPAVLTKTMFPFVWLLVLLIQLFSLRPSMPFVIGFSAGFIQIAFLVFTYFDSTTKFSTSLLAISEPNTVVVTYQAAAILSAIFSGLVGSYIVSSVRTMLIDAEFAAGDEVLFRENSSRAIGGTETVAAVVSAEIRNFTAETENLEAEQIFKVLSIYHRTMGAVIRSFGGKIAANNETLCAAFMFSVGSRRSNGAEQAVEAAKHMQSALIELNKVLLENKLPKVAVDIGIHCGTIAVGSLNINGRPVFTLAGETVTLAQRVKNACKTTETPVLFTSTIKEKLNHSVQVLPVGAFSIKEKNKKIALYTSVHFKGN